MMTSASDRDHLGSLALRTACLTAGRCGSGWL